MARHATATKQPSKPATHSAPTLQGGRPLQAHTRAKMDARFGHDFSSVRIHADDTAGRIARSAGANALTLGNDILFGSGRYTPGSRSSERLLSHELAHVVQQEKSGPGDPTRMSQRSDPSEREAEKAEDLIVAGSPVQINSAPDAAIARDGDGSDNMPFPGSPMIMDPNRNSIMNNGGASPDANAGSGAEPAGDEDESIWGTLDRGFDNPVFNSPIYQTLTHNTLSTGLSIHEEAGTSVLSESEEALRAQQRESMLKDLIRSDQPPLSPSGGTPSDPMGAAAPASNAASDIESAVGTASSAEQAAQTGIRGAGMLKGLSVLNKVMNPLGILSNSVSLYQDARAGHGFDAFADGAGLTGSGLSTALAFGANLGPAAPFVAAGAGGFAGGYAAGKLGLGAANSYAEDADLFGYRRNSTEAAVDAANNAQDWVQNIPYVPGFIKNPVGDFVGGVTAIGGSWATAGYSGIHALYDTIKGEDKEDNSIDIGAAMAQSDAQETQNEFMPSGSSAREEMPPLPQEMQKK